MSVYLLLLARIWVQGFGQLIAVLGLVSAALVVINKDNIINLVGFLIIMWRGLFSENDLIQVQSFRGVVQNVGVLYFAGGHGFSEPSGFDRQVFGQRHRG
jgi:small-conductance mechanosensitive channel